MPEMTLLQTFRFWAKVQKGEHWLWIANAPDKRYGMVTINNKHYRANRIAYWLYHQVDPGELLVCHSCQETLCVRKEHLHLGTHSDNNRDAHAFGNADHRGANNGHSFLSDEQIRKIRALEGTTSKTAIAEMFGVHLTTICCILSGKTWSHVQ